MPFQRGTMKVKKSVYFLRGTIGAKDVNLKHKVRGDLLSGDGVHMIGLPCLPVGEDQPLETLLDGVRFDLPEMASVELLGGPLDLDERDELLVDPDAVILLTAL